MANLIMGTRPEGHPERLTECAPWMHAAGPYLLLLTLVEPDPIEKYSRQLCPFTTLPGGKAGDTHLRMIGAKNTVYLRAVATEEQGWECELEDEAAQKRTDIKVTWC